MMQHPLPTLAACELPGWIAMGRRVVELLAKPQQRHLLLGQSPLAMLQQQIEGEVAIAEGLLAKSTTEASNGPQKTAETMRQMAREAWGGGLGHHQDPLLVVGDRLDSIEGRSAEAAADAQPPPAAAASMATSSVWTAERITVLARGYAAGTPRREILDAVNALPGPACASADSLHNKAVALGFVRRTPRTVPAAAETYTEERRALLRELYPTATPLPEILARLNALSGLPIPNEQALRVRARQLGIQRPKDQASIERPDSAVNEFTTEDLHEARELLDKGVDGRGLHEHFGGSLTYWAGFADKHRANKGAT